MKPFSILLSVILMAATTVQAQINVGSSSAPDGSAMLEISGTGKGFLPPRMSQGDMTSISNPAKGLIVFCTTDSLLYMRRDSGWMPLGGGDQIWSKSGGDIFNNNAGNNVGIGTSLPLARLHVVDSSVLFSADGDVSWSYDETSAISGAGRRMMWLPGKAAFRVGGTYDNLWDIDHIGYYSFAAGADAEAKGDISVAMGYGSSATGFAATALGEYTVASGDASLAAGFGTASGNASFATNYSTNAVGNGSSSFGYNTTANGQFSTAMGQQTVTGGVGAFATGFANNAGGEFSVASGYVSSASGQSSTAMGFFCDASATYAVAIGGHCTANADYTMALGTGSTASGSYSFAAGQGATASGYSSTAIGGAPTASGTGSMALGNGTTAPSGYETAVGAYNTTYTPASESGWDGSDRLFTIGNGAASFAASDAMVILKDGNVGFGTSTPTHKVDVVGDLAVSGIVTAANILNLSDARFKKDIRPLPYSLDAVMKLQGVSWQWKTAEFKDKGFTNDKQIGFIAQDVEKVVPEVVLTDTKGYKGIDYAKLTAVLTEAVKAQQQEILELKKQIAANGRQQETIDALSQRLLQLEQTMAQKPITEVAKRESR